MLCQIVFVNRKVNRTMTKKMGRPVLPKDKARTGFVGARLQLAEAHEIQNAISKSGRTKSEWIRDALLAAARQRASAKKK